jgi:hypothetical protein
MRHQVVSGQLVEQNEAGFVGFEVARFIIDIIAELRPADCE